MSHSLGIFLRRDLPLWNVTLSSAIDPSSVILDRMGRPCSV